MEHFDRLSVRKDKEQGSRGKGQSKSKRASHNSLRVMTFQVTCFEEQSEEKS